MTVVLSVILGEGSSPIIFSCTWVSQAISQSTSKQALNGVIDKYLPITWAYICGMSGS